MASVYFQRPTRFNVFKLFYVNEQKRRLHDNSHLQRFYQVYENLGGFDAIYNIFCAFERISAEEQKKIYGFTDTEIDAFLERKDCGRIYAEETSR